MSNLNVNNITPLAGVGGALGVSGSLNVSGSITLGGNVTANGNIVLGDSTSDSVSLGAEISSNLIPDQSNQFDLGSSAKRWKDVYIGGQLHGLSGSLGISGSIQISGSIIPQGDDQNDLGSSLRQWKDLYVDGVAYIDTIGNTVHATATSITSASIDAVSSNLVPASRFGTFDLGSSFKPWTNLHVKSGSIKHLVVTENVSSSLIPAATQHGGGMLQLLDLGGAGQEQWNRVYARTGSIGDLRALFISSSGDVEASRIFATDTDESPSAQIALKDASDNSIVQLTRMGSSTNAHRGKLILRDHDEAVVTITALGPYGESGHISSSGALQINDITASGDIAAKGNIVGDGGTDITGINRISGNELHALRITASALPTSEAAAGTKEFFTLSGSQIFSSSAFPGGADPAKIIFNSAGFSSSLFVFLKP